MDLLVAPCATVTGLGTATVTVDFGSSGTCSNDGRIRTGKLIFTLANTSLRYRNPGFSVNVSSQNYTVDSIQVNIVSKTITNTTPSNIPQTGTPAVNLTWSINASVNVVKPNGHTFSWSCSRTKELVNTSDPNCYHGQLQPIDWAQAIIRLNGSSSGTNSMNESFTATITNLTRNFQCTPLTSRPFFHPFISGTLSYTPGSRPTRLIDYGSGACDNLATLTINSQSYMFNL